MQISHTTLKRLVLLNTALVILGIVTLVALAIMFRPQVKEVLRDVKNDVVQNLKKSTLYTERAQTADLPVYQLSIKSDDLRRIEVITRNAASEGVLLKPNKIWVPAQFVYDNKRYKAKVRVRGDLANHWNSSVKSWRVKFNRDNLFQGKREINLIIPADKAYETEAVAYKIARKLGLLVPDAGFARLKINNIDMGLYFWSEQPGKEMLEKLQYPNGEIFNADNVWVDTRYNAFGIESGFDSYPAYYSGNIQEGPIQGRIVKRWQELLELVRDADPLIYAQKIPLYINIDKFVKWSALSWVFGSAHAQQIDNVRWYYDTTTGRFEPILYDVNVYSLGQWDGSKRVDQSHQIVGPKTTFDTLIGGHKIINKTLQVPDVQFRRNQELWKLLNSEDLDFVKMMRNEYQSIRSFLDIGLEAKNKPSEDYYQSLRIQKIVNNQKLLKKWLGFSRSFSDIKMNENDHSLSMSISPDGLAGLYLDGVEFFGIKGFNEKGLEITLQNPYGETKEVNIDYVKKNNTSVVLAFDTQFLYTVRSENLMPIPSDWRLTIRGVVYNEKDAFQVDDFLPLLRNAITKHAVEGYRNRRTASLYENKKEAPVTTPFMPVDQFIARSGLPFKKVGQTLKLEKGEYELHESLNFPKDYGLSLLPGVKIKMGVGANILLHQPLIALGTAEENVIIEPADASQPPWGTVSVIAANGVSQIKHTQISGGSEAWLNGKYLSGQLNFYHSDVTLSDVRISHAHADDGLNVKRAKVRIENSYFSENASDAFDGDWVEAIIENTIFLNNKGDGVDFSGSNVVIKDSWLSHMGDKGISAGEKSEIWVYHTTLDGSSIGVASKDQSHVSIYASLLTQNKTGISLYQKKDIFGPADVTVYGSLIAMNNKDFTVQDASVLELKGTTLVNQLENQKIKSEELHFISPENQISVRNKRGLPVVKPAVLGEIPTELKTKPVSVNGLVIPDLSTVAPLPEHVSLR
ncbi:exported hypothetical protein [Candidatus Terasakiella magnetica]|uniref:Right handed beta helix domain-containing protein n=1 Tax=Candidatus Terasakiella magnetica TaxID=1867952 RepID=A0A1C3RG06_9PROT|nr:CotH kinase family protein [Candidatus Terasakiella magnetica]SCA56233.1 exported hypothetical protein [Candidatus Terasakiella magnetica]